MESSTCGIFAFPKPCYLKCQPWTGSTSISWESFKNAKSGVPTVAQQVKDSALSQWWHRSQLWAWIQSLGWELPYAKGVPPSPKCKISGLTSNLLKNLQLNKSWKWSICIFQLEKHCTKKVKLQEKITVSSSRVLELLRQPKVLWSKPSLGRETNYTVI